VAQAANIPAAVNIAAAPIHALAPRKSMFILQ
jgi:hypothetical protein